MNKMYEILDKLKTFPTIMDTAQEIVVINYLKKLSIIEIIEEKDIFIKILNNIENSHMDNFIMADDINTVMEYEEFAKWLKKIKETKELTNYERLIDSVVDTMTVYFPNNGWGIKDMNFACFIQQILNNKNDLCGNTFMYVLKEDQIFDFSKLNVLIGYINNCTNVFKEINIFEIKEEIIINLVDTLFWILSSTYKLIIYNYNKNDLYKIRIFKNGLESEMIDNIDLLTESINKLCNILLKIKK